MGKSHTRETQAAKNKAVSHQRDLWLFQQITRVILL
jgi:hypothetical protein